MSISGICSRMQKRYSIYCIIICLLGFGFSSCDEQMDSTSNEIMYFILIDRFVDGDPSNNSGGVPESYLQYNGSNPEALKHYQGGDLAGITQSLDSLKAMGITMIWISPFMDNSNTDYVGWWPYHGYHPIDFYSVDEHYGSLEDLKFLVDSAHSRNMKIIFDMPFNQTAADHHWLEDSSKIDWFHLDDTGKPFEITDWFDQVQIEEGELHGLPDLAQENAAVAQYLFDVSKYWIEETGCDGFRLDAVKHIPQSFWQLYNRKIKELAGPDFLLFGEVFWGDPMRIAPYLDKGFDYLFDIPGYYAIRNTFNKGASIKDFSEFYKTTQGVLGNYPLATLIDNHDVARFNVGLTDNAWQKQYLALGWMLTSPGLPVLYSGTEYGMPGYPPLDEEGNPQDYLNRLPYPVNPTEVETEYRKQLTTLIQLRHQYPAFGNGQFREIYQDWSIYAYLRFDPTQQLLVILNNASTEEFVSIPLQSGLDIKKAEPVFGGGVLRLEQSELWLRLPPLSTSVWTIHGNVDPTIQHWVEFTDRLSHDYQNVQLYLPDRDDLVKQLRVAGDFNNWTATEYHSFRRGDTVFVEIPLKAGEYQYKLVINGTEWIADQNSLSFILDPYGGRNSVLRVSN